MSIRDIVDVSITIEDKPISRVGFGTPLILGAHKNFNERLKFYSSLEEISNDGFIESDPEYVAALKILSQPVTVQQIAIGRRSVDQVMIWISTVLDSTDYELKINDTTFIFNSGIAATDLTIATGIVALVTAGTEPVAATDNADGSYMLDADVNNVAYTVKLDARQTMAKPFIMQDTIENDLEGVLIASENWYGLNVVSRMQSEVKSAAALIEGLPNKLYITTSSNTDIADSESTTDIAFELKELGYEKTGGIFNKLQPTEIEVNTVLVGQVYFAVINGTKYNYTALGGNTKDIIAGELVDLINAGAWPVKATDNEDGTYSVETTVKGVPFAIYVDTKQAITQISDQFADAAWMGEELPTEPGSTTWAFKNLIGVAPDELNTEERINIHAKKWSTYEDRGGSFITFEGWVSSGKYLDITRGIAWLRERMIERIYALLVNTPKVPYTDAGISSIEAEIRAQLDEGIRRNVLSDIPAYTVTAAKAADIPAQDKVDRILREITFTATLAGAIHKVRVRGTVTL